MALSLAVQSCGFKCPGRIGMSIVRRSLRLLFTVASATGRGYVGTFGPQMHGPERLVNSASPQGENQSSARFNDVAIEA